MLGLNCGGADFALVTSNNSFIVTAMSIATFGLLNARGSCEPGLRAPAGNGPLGAMALVPIQAGRKPTELLGPAGHEPASKPDWEHVAGSCSHDAERNMGLLWPFAACVRGGVETSRVLRPRSAATARPAVAVRSSVTRLSHRIHPMKDSNLDQHQTTTRAADGRRRQ